MDKERDHIDKRVASSFAGQPKKAPADLWSGISASMDLSSDELAVKESFASVGQKTAPKSGWSGVKRQLIIDDVWANIAAFQDRRKRRAIIWWWSGSLATVLVLSLLIWSWWSVPVQRVNFGQFIPVTKGVTSDVDQKLKLKGFEKNDREGQSQSNVSPQGVDSFLSTPQEGRNSSSLSDLNAGDSNPLSVEYHTSGDLNASRDLEANVEAIHNSGINNSQREVAEVSGVNSLAIQNIETTSHSERSLESFDEFLDLRRFSRFEVGAHVAAGNTWIFNSDVRKGLRANTLIKDKVSIGHSFGAELVFNINKRSSLYGIYDFMSVVRQNYEMYRGGSLVNRSITLNQQKALIGYRHRFNDRKLNKRNFVLRSGVFFAHAINEEITTGEENKLIGFERVDFGVSVAGGIEHQFERLSFEYGLRSDVGLNNVFSGTTEIPKSFDYTNTFTMEAYLSLRYKL